MYLSKALFEQKKEMIKWIDFMIQVFLCYNMQCHKKPIHIPSDLTYTPSQQTVFLFHSKWLHFSILELMSHMSISFVQMYKAEKDKFSSLDSAYNTSSSDLEMYLNHISRGVYTHTNAYRADMAINLRNWMVLYWLFQMDTKVIPEWDIYTANKRAMP